MRSLVYAAAFLAAAGIMFVIAMNPGDPPAEPADQAASAEPIDTTVEPVKVVAAKMTLNVPEMHCPFACYPAVKEKLESRQDVVTVELAPQKEEGVIDNRQVIVSYAEGFAPDDAIAMLESAGFGGSTVAE